MNRDPNRNPNRKPDRNLNRKLNRINGIIAGGTRPEVTITYFEPDNKKAGGRYATVTAQVRRIDTAARKVILITRDRDVILSSGAEEYIVQ